MQELFSIYHDVDDVEQVTLMNLILARQGCRPVLGEESAGSTSPAFMTAVRSWLAECRRVLAAEGMEPTPKIERLAARLLAG